VLGVEREKMGEPGGVGGSVVRCTKQVIDGGYRDRSLKSVFKQASVQLGGMDSVLTYRSVEKWLWKIVQK
jgi:hypothetical protein